MFPCFLSRNLWLSLGRKENDENEWTHIETVSLWFYLSDHYVIIPSNGWCLWISMPWKVAIDLLHVSHLMFITFSQNCTCTIKDFCHVPPTKQKKNDPNEKIIICRITFLSSSWLKVESKSSSVASTISSIFCRLALPLLDEAEETGGPSRFTGRQRDSSSARYCILMFPNMFPKTYPVKNPFSHMFPRME